MDRHREVAKQLQKARTAMHRARLGLPVAPKKRLDFRSRKSQRDAAGVEAQGPNGVQAGRALVNGKVCVNEPH